METSRKDETVPRRPLVAAIVIIVVFAGALGGLYWWETVGSSPRAHPVRDDGPTFYQALALLNSSVENQSGGPWSIFSVMGIAAQDPYSPNVKGYVSLNNNVPVNGCQTELNGLTMFNGSIPTFDGTFNSGTAPFWQFAYYSNDSAEILVGTDVLGTPHLFPPFSLQSNCTSAWGDFSLDPTRWTDQIYSNSSIPPDSSVAASVVWSHVDSGYLDAHQPQVQLFTSGPAMLAVTQDIPHGILGVDFVSCGLAGFTGYGTGWPAGNGLAYYSGVNKNGSYAGAFNATTNCFLGNAATVPGAITGEYQMLFSNASASTVADTTWFTASTAVNFALTGGGEYYDMWGLANWMLGLGLTTPADQQVALSTSGCAEWVSSVSDCKANVSGWYAVLLSANGEWLASYGLTATGTPGWTVPVTAVVSQQRLVVVVPESWSISGDELSINSTISYATIAGTATL